MKVAAKLVAYTQPTIEVGVPNAEALVAYCARVSNPSNQNNHETAEGLLKYCIRNKHWSVFEMVNAVVEVEAPRDITRQLLRHDFRFQEFSQRYSDEIEFTERNYRRQDEKNRQNSVNDDDVDGFGCYITKDVSENLGLMYKQLRAYGVAKECARVILPEGLTMSRLYVNGNMRNWLHYLDVREEVGVSQWEHVLLAREIRKALEPAFPVILGLKDVS